jgi:hypothetical protein
MLFPSVYAYSSNAALSFIATYSGKIFLYPIDIAREGAPEVPNNLKIQWIIRLTIIKRLNKDGAIDPERGFSLFPNGRTVYDILSLKQVIQTTCINCNYHLSNYNPR